MNKKLLEDFFNRDKNRFLREWGAFLRFKSISADPAYNDSCSACARWLMQHFQGMGFKAELIPTGAKPLLFAHYKASEGRPTILFYGHYDVQPVDPLELWETDPFEAVERAGRIYARGAQDNKGQSFAFIKAVETLIRKKKLDVSIKVIFEGEEEIGSLSLRENAVGLNEKLKSDILMVCDSGTIRPDVATITMGLRGIIHLEIKLIGPDRDLHSGVHGGVAPNPATALCKLIASLHDENGRIAIEGFYDGIETPSDTDKVLAASTDLDRETYKARTGVYPDGGEKGFSISERRGFRPSIDVNGMKSGYLGEGQKTIIPRWASVKLSARVAGGQDAHRCLDLLVEHLRKQVPQSLSFEVINSGVSGGAMLLSTESPSVQRAVMVLKDLMGQEPLYTWEGASIPVVPVLNYVSTAEPVLVGFGLEEDNMHAPNESFAIEQFRKCYMYCGMFLSSFPEKEAWEKEADKE